MNKQQWQNRIDELEKEIIELEKELADLKANPPKRELGERWKPEKGERYWFACKDGSILQRWWGDNVVENETFNNFNIFETEEEAEFAKERTEVMRELDTWAMDNVRTRESKYRFYYDFDDDRIKIAGNFIKTISSHVFESEEIAKKAIEAIGEDRLRKYYFKVVD